MSDRVRRFGTALRRRGGAGSRPAVRRRPRSAAPADPVTVTLQSLEPHDLRPDSTVQVTALLRNTSASSTGPLTVRLRRGTILGTRGELQLTDTDTPTTGVASGPSQDLAGGLAPGQSQQVRYSSTVADLGLSGLQSGVYPIALTVQSDRRDRARPAVDPAAVPAGRDRRHRGHAAVAAAGPAAPADRRGPGQARGVHRRPAGPLGVPGRPAGPAAGRGRRGHRQGPAHPGGRPGDDRGAGPDDRVGRLPGDDLGEDDRGRHRRDRRRGLAGPAARDRRRSTCWSPPRTRTPTWSRWSAAATRRSASSRRPTWTRPRGCSACSRRPRCPGRRTAS